MSAIVTSADERLANARLRAVGITAPVLVTVDDITRGKPDPEGYLLGARRLGVAPARCVVVEDASIGVDAAHAAGMRALGVATTYAASALAHAEVVTESLGAVRVRLEGREIELRV